jgi:hypothetical protein
MRLFIVGVATLLLVPSAAAQSRWTVSAGPEWTPLSSGTFYGARVRAEYDLIKPTGPLRLRFEAGGSWSPTQSYYGSYSIPDLGTFGGTRQILDLQFGLSAALTPLPRARFSPYVVMAVVARQSWRRGSGWAQTPGAPVQNYRSTYSAGDILLQPGIGIRARIAGRMFQVEMRRAEHSNALLIGTSLPF